MTASQEQEGVYAYHPLSQIGVTIIPNVADVDAFLAPYTNPSTISENTGSMLMLLLDTEDTIHAARIDGIEGKAPTATFLFTEADDSSPVRLKPFNPARAGKLTLTIEDFFSFKWGNTYFHVLENVTSEQHLLQILHHAPNLARGPLFEQDDVIAFITAEQTTEPTLHLYTLDSDDNGVTTILLPTRFVEDDEADLPEAETSVALQATS